MTLLAQEGEEGEDLHLEVAAVVVHVVDLDDLPQAMTAMALVSS